MPCIDWKQALGNTFEYKQAYELVEGIINIFVVFLKKRN
jgi:hypothetical protein